MLTPARTLTTVLETHRQRFYLSRCCLAPSFLILRWCDSTAAAGFGDVSRRAEGDPGGLAVLKGKVVIGGGIGKS